MLIVNIYLSKFGLFLFHYWQFFEYLQRLNERSYNMADISQVKNKTSANEVGPIKMDFLNGGSEFSTLQFAK